MCRYLHLVETNDAGDLAFLPTTRGAQKSQQRLPDEDEQLIEYLPEHPNVLQSVPQQDTQAATPPVDNPSTPLLEYPLSPQAGAQYAYAFVIGGCDPEKHNYLGFIYNIIVSTRRLRQEGSTAEVVTLFQISYDSPAETLAPEDVRILTEMGVKIKYIPKSPVESFYHTVLNKFDILGLTEYRRVLLMDGDVMPLSNLDYLFYLSETGVLKENVVVNGPWEPANAGFFMLAPKEGDLDQVHSIIEQREKEAATSTIKFDEVVGWGHIIEPPDEWVGRKERGRNWTFHFAFSDQGLCKSLNDCRE